MNIMTKLFAAIISGLIGLVVFIIVYHILGIFTSYIILWLEDKFSMKGGVKHVNKYI